MVVRGPFGVQALACPTQCSLKPELRTCSRHDTEFDHFVNFVATKRNWLWYFLTGSEKGCPTHWRSRRMGIPIHEAPTAGAANSEGKKSPGLMELLRPASFIIWVSDIA